MIFQAFRMKTTKMFFIVVYDHTRSKYFYAFNVYHRRIERMEKKCWRANDHIYHTLTAHDLTDREFLVLDRAAYSHICVERKIASPIFRKKLVAEAANSLKRFLKLDTDLQNYMEA